MRRHGWKTAGARWEMEPESGFYVWEEEAHGAGRTHALWIEEAMVQHLTAEDRLWLAVPLFWSFGAANALPAILTHGGCVVLQDGFEPGEALDILDRERCSVYYGMANMARAMLEHPDRPRRAQLGCGVRGGAGARRRDSAAGRPAPAARPAPRRQQHGHRPQPPPHHHKRQRHPQQQ